jgi:hypothetical protein
VIIAPVRMAVRELIVPVDDHERRGVWSTVAGSLTHHNASAQVIADPAGRSRVDWIAWEITRNPESRGNADISVYRA